jgi:hypothetical protein
MEDNTSQTNRLGPRILGLVGAAAFVALGALSMAYGHVDSGRVDLAGSGDAPADTVYVQPTENAMNLGATATFTTPSSVAPVAKAVPKSDG